ncbi:MULTISPECIES: MOSC domain-containing protein [Cytobacillus]|uniref:MOSC domain-containing protein n=1 Tax=Cytobacillus TaxID=2675230 RepID=UPI00203E357E|nr:MOSC domain-containing protein [Cytobacillus firmus]MCM3708778.1 MOSC domain-containing protein [Cytobacillus firmus]
MLIGRIKEIVRYPVKSFHGESVDKTNVMSYGLYGDRSHAYLDESRPGKYFTITQFPEMVRYKAEFIGEENRNRYPPVRITAPDGKQVPWDDKQLIKEIEEHSSAEITPVQYSPIHVPEGAIEEENILVVTDASLKKMKQLWGKGELDFQRFRPNLVLSLVKDEPFMEDQWFGKTLKIGNVELIVKRHCERCMIITVDPESGERDPGLHQKVISERNNHFGVYAAVLKTGEIAAGDEVYLFE